MEYPTFDPAEPAEVRYQKIQAYYDWREQERKRKRQLIESRYKSLGYKSLADFCRRNNFGVTAGTVGNYLKGNGTMPLYFLPKLCYALLMTPNELLALLEIYDPSKMKVSNNE